ncbi:MAG: FAD-binding oxidoreductase [Burkholderiaceae bacterium]|nr:FAD-binding oxidoreductase [Microbacteriaceae bacterium]
MADATDIAVVMRFAAGHDHGVAVQLIGHGALEHTRPTLLVQTRFLDEVEIRDHTAWGGSGVRWETVLAAAAPLGLMPLAGSAPRVGVVGYLTGGGLSPIGRGYGFASDLVTAIDVVTGDGTILRATPSENTDLFWGLRGGKGALGIVSAVEFTLVDLPEFFGGCLYFSAADVADVTHR